MIDDWFSLIELPLTFQQFERLPQNPAFKYEYFDHQAWLTPRPKSYHAMLDLKTFVRPIDGMVTNDAVDIGPLGDEDWQRLPGVFAAAFHRVQPFAGLTREARVQAAEECLRETKEGRWGPLVGEACLAARLPDGAPVAALLTTLLPAGDPAEWDAWRWRAPPPADAVARQIGRPHLTWIFVGPWFARQGVGMFLLDAAVGALSRLGYSELGSTFLLGNESSTLWHWRAGFRLVPYPGSTRVIREQARRDVEESKPAEM